MKTTSKITFLGLAILASVASAPAQPQPGCAGLPKRWMIDAMLRAHPNSPENWVWSAREKLCTGNHAGAVADAKQALKLEPGNKEAMDLLRLAETRR